MPRRQGPQGQRRAGGLLLVEDRVGVGVRGLLGLDARHAILQLGWDPGEDAAHRPTAAQPAEPGPAHLAHGLVPLVMATSSRASSRA